MIKLVLPSSRWTEQLKQFKKVLLKSNSPFHGTDEFAQTSIDKWIQRCEDHRFGRALPEGHVPATLFMAVDTDGDRIVGLIQIRHSLTQNLLQNGGNIGYTTIGDERLSKYVGEMLRLALEECKKIGLKRVLITCDKWNMGSAKTIIANGGKMENEIVSFGDAIQRYWINI